MSRYRVLKKSHDALLAGVAAGMGEFVGWSPDRARIGWVVFGFLSGGLALVIYALFAFLFPANDHFDLDNYRQ